MFVPLTLSYHFAGYGLLSVQTSVGASSTASVADLHRCKPYAIPLLDLLSPLTTPVSILRFFQSWQALPYRTELEVDTIEQDFSGPSKLLRGIHAAPMTCIMQVRILTSMDHVGTMLSIVLTRLGMLVPVGFGPDTVSDPGSVSGLHVAG